MPHSPHCAPHTHAHTRAPLVHNNAQGLGATLLRNTPANAIYLGNFEMMKAAYASKYNCAAADIPGWVVLTAAGEQLLLRGSAPAPLAACHGLLQLSACRPVSWEGQWLLHFFMALCGAPRVQGWAGRRTG